VALIDDDPSKLGNRILGVPVLGSLEALQDAIGRYQPDAVILSTSKLTPERRARLSDICYESGTNLLQLDFRLSPLQQSGRSVTDHVTE
jgi:FlaA1/EpsC-like NDP-sugar epimerase